MPIPEHSDGSENNLIINTNSLVSGPIMIGYYEGESSAPSVQHPTPLNQERDQLRLQEGIG
ncbi:hypothetical protein SAY87_010250 [Trapa incisa]|uniref:Uncharacterized protein n=1 Tax=Trapa incisa TaxID=236973 RepID=A0AAN7GGU1_9MYRT|nr:hypothetical protein SAY87_010250 [Trapa incisa]